MRCTCEALGSLLQTVLASLALYARSTPEQEAESNPGVGRVAAHAVETALQESSAQPTPNILAAPVIERKVEQGFLFRSSPHRANLQPAAMFPGYTVLKFEEIRAGAAGEAEARAAQQWLDTGALVQEPPAGLVARDESGGYDTRSAAARHYVLCSPTCCPTGAVAHTPHVRPAPPHLALLAVALPALNCVCLFNKIYYMPSRNGRLQGH